MKFILLKLIALYRLLLSPLLGRNCRFHPTCSRYMEECLESMPLFKALCHGLRRVLKCHPWHPGGHDPVPKSSSNSTERNILGDS